MDEARMARTESAFREVNEAIKKTAERFEADEAGFVCECADPACAEPVTAGLDDYDAVRSDATRFLIAPGHEVRPLERVVERNDEYEVIEKLGRTMRRIVRDLNPRAA